jgi:hypothetical protein
VDAGGETEQGLEGGHGGTSAVEAEGELVEVGLEVSVADAMVGSAEPGLEIAKDAVDVRQDLSRSLGGAQRNGGDGGSRVPAAKHRLASGPSG